MLRKFSTLCCFVLAIAVVVNSANANLSLVVTPDGDLDNMLPNSTVTLTISLEFDPGAPFDFQSFNGADFFINTGALRPTENPNNPDEPFLAGNPFFGATEFLIPPGAGTVGSWTDFPAPGGNRRFFTGGPTLPFSFGAEQPPFNGLVLPLGSIVLHAGTNLGNYEGFFSETFFLDANSLDIEGVNVPSFSYSVVPEPSAAMLVGLASSLLAIRRRRG